MFYTKPVKSGMPCRLQVTVRHPPTQSCVLTNVSRDTEVRLLSAAGMACCDIVYSEHVLNIKCAVKCIPFRCMENADGESYP